MSIEDYSGMGSTELQSSLFTLEERCALKTPSSSSYAYRDIKVLIVDDSMLARTILREVLRDEGYDVIGESTSGGVALEMIAEQMPDIITLDVNMPGMDGLVVLNHIQAHFPSILVVMVTASGERKVIRSAFDAGAIGYIPKPLTVDKIARLFSRLALVLENSRKNNAAKLERTIDSLDREKPRGVVIDDSKTMRKLLRAILEDGGYYVVGDSNNGMDGLIQIEKYQPDFVCLDISLPQIDGLQSLKCIKAIHPHLPVVMISSHAGRDSIEKAIKNGANGYLIKPFDPESVLDAVHKALHST